MLGILNRRELRVKRIVNTFFTSNTFVLSMRGQDKVWLVDCGDWWQVKKLLKGSKVKGVLMSHTHADHIYGLNELLKDFPDAVIYTNEFGVSALSNAKLNITKYHDEVPDFVLMEGAHVQVIDEGCMINLFEGVKVEVLSVPGHDKSCLAYIVGTNLFTGDSYIPTAKLTAKFPNSNKQDARASYERLVELGKNYTVRPGHGPSK